MIFNKNLLFLHVPKTAGMSITEYLERHLARPIFITAPVGHHENVSSVRGIFKKLFRKRPDINYLDGKRHEDLIEAKSFFDKKRKKLHDFKAILAVARNPYDMEVSRYCYLRLGHPWDKGPAQKVAMNSDFETFVADSLYHGRKTPELERYYVIDGKTPSNMRIIKYENLQEEFFKVLSDIGETVEGKLPLTNVSKHDHYLQYLTPKAEEAVYNKFRWFFDSGLYERAEV